jgi:hypothetical protein
MGNVFRSASLPSPPPADNDRIGGWMLMYRMLKDGSWKVSSVCPRLIDSIPSLVHAPPPHQEDVLKVEGGDAADSARYGLKSRFGQIKEPVEMKIMREVTSPITDLTSRHIEYLAAEAKHKKSQRPIRFGRRLYGPRRRP